MYYLIIYIYICHSFIAIQSHIPSPAKKLEPTPFHLRSDIPNSHRRPDTQLGLPRPCSVLCAARGFRVLSALLEAHLHRGGEHGQGWKRLGNGESSV